MPKRSSRKNEAKIDSGDLHKIREVLKLVHLAEIILNVQLPSEPTIGKVSSSDIHIMQLRQFSELIMPRSRFRSSLMDQLSNAAEHVLRYLNADETKVAGTTYSAIRQLLRTVEYKEVYSDTALMNNVIVALQSLDDQNAELASNDSCHTTIPANTVLDSKLNVSQSESVNENFEAANEQLVGDVHIKMEASVMKKLAKAAEVIEQYDNVIIEEAGGTLEETAANVESVTSDEEDVEAVECSLSSLVETNLEATTLTVEPQMYDALIQVGNSNKTQVDGNVLTSAVFNKDVLRSFNRTCPFCSKVYCNDVSLRAHLFTHSSQKQYACPMCPRSFTQNGHRSEHIRRLHCDERPYVCMYCDRSFASASHLRLHLKAHGIPLDKRRTRATGPVRCDICGQELANRQTLASHRRLHTGEKPIVCPVCGLTFHDPSYFWRHRQKHRPATVSPTSKQAPTPCVKCGKVFGSAELMRVHQRVHSSRRPYVCAKCGDAFKRPGDLRLHDRTHTGHKPYQCQTCGVSFTQAHSLKNHVRCHTNERPHSCSVCSKAFRTADKLRVHFRVHTGERPHVCNVCSFSFADRSALRRHLKRHEMRNETISEKTPSSVHVVTENTLQT